jgi:hypothetical protein
LFVQEFPEVLAEARWAVNTYAATSARVGRMFVVHGVYVNMLRAKGRMEGIINEPNVFRIDPPATSDLMAAYGNGDGGRKERLHTYVEAALVALASPEYPRYGGWLQARDFLPIPNL